MKYTSLFFLVLITFNLVMYFLDPRDLKNTLIINFILSLTFLWNILVRGNFTFTWKGSIIGEGKGILHSKIPVKIIPFVDVFLFLFFMLSLPFLK